MKKYFKLILSLLLVACTLTLLTACQTPVQQNYPVDFNQLLAKGYNHLQIELTTKHQMGTLVNTYDVTEVSEGVKVDYSCQSFAQLSLSQPTDNCINTAVGSVVYANGEEISQSGDKVLYSLPKSTTLNLNLSTANMTNLTETDANNITANVTDASLLLGQSVSATDTCVCITFTAEAISKIVITYTTQSTQVTLCITLA